MKEEDVTPGTLYPLLDNMLFFVPDNLKQNLCCATPLGHRVSQQSTWAHHTHSSGLCSLVETTSKSNKTFCNKNKYLLIIGQGLVPRAAFSRHNIMERSDRNMLCLSDM